MCTGLRQPGLKADNSHATGSEVKGECSCRLHAGDELAKYILFYLSANFKYKVYRPVDSSPVRGANKQTNKQTNTAPKGRST